MTRLQINQFGADTEPHYYDVLPFFLRFVFSMWLSRLWSYVFGLWSSELTADLFAELQTGRGPELV